MDKIKLIIAGGRDYKFTEQDIAFLDTFAKSVNIVEVVSGAAAGADAEGERWAKSRGIPVKQFPADWRAYSFAAGPMRNKQMAKYADHVILFPGGKGTRSMATEAEKAGISCTHAGIQKETDLAQHSPARCTGVVVPLRPQPVDAAAAETYDASDDVNEESARPAAADTGVKKYRRKNKKVKEENDA